EVFIDVVVEDDVEVVDVDRLVPSHRDPLAIRADAVRRPQLRTIVGSLQAAHDLARRISLGAAADDYAEALAPVRRRVPAIGLRSVVYAHDARLAGFHRQHAIGHARIGERQAEAQPVLDAQYRIAARAWVPAEVELDPLRPGLRDRDAGARQFGDRQIV